MAMLFYQTVNGMNMYESHSLVDLTDLSHGDGQPSEGCRPVQRKVNCGLAESLKMGQSENHSLITMFPDFFR